MKVGRKGNDLLGERFGRLLVTAELQSLGGRENGGYAYVTAVIIRE
jgi:hypothetical protein